MIVSKAKSAVSRSLQSGDSVSTRAKLGFGSIAALQGTSSHNTILRRIFSNPVGHVIIFSS